MPQKAIMINISTIEMFILWVVFSLGSQKHKKISQLNEEMNVLNHKVGKFFLTGIFLHFSLNLIFKILFWNILALSCVYFVFEVFCVKDISQG